MCVVPECDKTNIRARGLCRMHYARWERHGDVNVSHRGWMVDDPGYFTKHGRVKRKRGSASLYPCVGSCGGPARDWATIHGADGLDVMADYQPMCRVCHFEYDEIIGSPKGIENRSYAVL